MVPALNRYFTKLERNLRPAPDADYGDPAVRRRATAHFLLFDHHLLRFAWTNLGTVADGVFRSNQPTASRLRKMRDKMRIKAVLNLRGVSTRPYFQFNRQACEQLGLDLHVADIQGHRVNGRETLIKLLDTFREIRRPFVLHCKSGADRSGLAAALYRVIILGHPVEEARKELSFRYLHASWTRSGICGFLFDHYLAETKNRPMDLETWIREVYDPETFMQAYEARVRG